LSVLMSRPDACTVSRTVATLDADVAELTYSLLEAGEIRTGTTRSLELRRARAA
jgi:ribosomal protein L17